MIVENLQNFKIKRTKNKSMTTYPGAALIGSLYESMGLRKKMDRELRLKKRERGYSVSEYTLSLIGMIVAGGESLEDISMFDGDEGTRKLFGAERLPAANSLGEFLRRFESSLLIKLADYNTMLALKLHKLEKLDKITIDIDSTLIECYKENAKRTYKGFYGYDPLLAMIAETGSVIRGIFREGNQAPQANNLSLLRQINRRLPKDIAKKYFRSDSAAYNHKVMKYCDGHNIRFTITAEQNSAVRGAAIAINAEDWVPFEDGHIAETVHVPGPDIRDSIAYRLIVQRTVQEQPDMFSGPYKYHAIITNMQEEWSPQNIVFHHRKRGKAENVIKENKYGFALDKYPCSQLLANSAFFQINLLAYNLCQLFKYQALPESWRTLSIKNLRYRLFNVAGYVSRHARRLYLSLSENYPYYSVFENARYRILSLAYT